MSAPVGIWRINANGFRGSVSINADANGNLSGTCDIDAGFTDQLSGVWNEAAQEVTFNRTLVRNGNTAIQTYTGYLYLTQDDIFQGQGPSPQPSERLMTGSFDGVGTGAANGRAYFGWVARQPLRS
jgi:hypothetical protein